MRSASQRKHVKSSLIEEREKEEEEEEEKDEVSCTVHTYKYIEKREGF